MYVPEIVLAIFIILFVIVAHAAFYHANRTVEAAIASVARIPSRGSWQNDTDFFDKIEEFRNDFA